MQVALNITEGPQTTVGKLSIEGNSVFSDDQIRAIISAAEGQPYSDSTVINDQTQVMDAYFNRGFPDIKFEYASTPDPNDPNRINISYKIIEGREIFVDKVLISGLNYTRPFVVEREMKLRTGQPLSQQKMLNTQSRLYDMGIFNEVNMAVQNPEGDATHKNVNYQLREAKRYTFNYGVGLEVQTGQSAGTTNPGGTTGVSPRVSFDITRLNFRGRDHTVTLKTRYGSLEKLALLGYGDPRVFDAEHLSLNLTAFYEQTNDVKTFTANRLEGAAEIKQIFSKAVTLHYRLIYRRVSTENLVIDPNNIPLFSQPVRVGLPDFSYIRDTRDNPIESRKGSFNTVDTGVAAGIFGSQASFVRIVGQNSTYYQFHKRRWVLARSTRIGIEEPFGQTTLIPLPERFFAGGSTSLRGFGINQAGPRDLSTGFPLGGNALFVNNVELRTPPVPFPFVGDNLSLALFHDMGNVFATSGDMVNSLFKFTQPNRDTCFNPTAQNCNFNYNPQSIGAGIRYRTPVGPVSIDMGYNLNPTAFPIGAPAQPAPPAPPIPPSSQVLRHFNFFFNIGQTF
jgi:outer membrane protein assembly complex protein YaeT